MEKPNHSLDQMNFHVILMALVTIMYSVYLFQQLKIPGIFWFYFLQVGFGFVVQIFVHRKCSLINVWMDYNLVCYDLLWK